MQHDFVILMAMPIAPSSVSHSQASNRLCSADTEGVINTISSAYNITCALTIALDSLHRQCTQQMTVAIESKPCRTPKDTLNTNDELVLDLLDNNSAGICLSINAQWFTPLNALVRSIAQIFAVLSITFIY